MQNLKIESENKWIPNHWILILSSRAILQECCFKSQTRAICLLTTRTIRTMFIFSVPATKADVMYLHSMYKFKLSYNSSKSDGRYKMDTTFKSASLSSPQSSKSCHNIRKKIIKNLLFLKR